MKFLGIFLLIIGLSILGHTIYSLIYSNYEYTKDIGSYWDLAEKASTINQKSEYIDKYVAALEEAKLEGEYDALWLFTPAESFDENFKALKSLQTRLHNIQTMDIQSFEYQTAIQQITGQEQGEALQMITTFNSIWVKVHYFNIWSVMLLFTFLIPTLTVITGIFVLAYDGY